MSLLHVYGPLIVATPVLGLISDIDRRTKRIPDRLSLLVLAMTASTITLLTLVGDQRADATNAAIGAVVLGSILGALHAIRPDGLGMGDVKLALTLGLLLGWTRSNALDVALMIAWCLMLASALGLLSVATMMRRQDISARGTAVPFGPSLCAGAVVVTIVGPSLILG